MNNQNRLAKNGQVRMEYRKCCEDYQLWFGKETTKKHVDENRESGLLACNMRPDKGFL